MKEIKARRGRCTEACAIKTKMVGCDSKVRFVEGREYTEQNKPSIRTVVEKKMKNRLGCYCEDRNIAKATERGTGYISSGATVSRRKVLHVLEGER